MKICPHCKIEVEGGGQICPLCQNYLEGEASPDKWPYAVKLKKQSLLYKLQLFVSLTAAVICLGLDFMMDLSGKLHWSIIVCAVIFALQMVIRHIFKTWYNLSRVITISVFYISIVLMIIFGYVGLWKVCMYVIFPILWTALMIINLILVFVDKSGNAMAYLLLVFPVNIIFYWIVLTVTKETHTIWSISLLVTAVALIALFIFKGRGAIGEMKKRLSM